jgi:hypothetical protein
VGGGGKIKKEKKIMKAREACVHIIDMMAIVRSNELRFLRAT